jgi:cation diffusion facilitator family transporter
MDPSRASSDQAPADPSPEGSADGSTVTVLLALAANVGVGVLKLAAGLLTGSGALLSEAAHSVGDTSTELLLLTALRRSSRPADRRHPFGYGKERYFWSLLAAVGILLSGAAFSFFEGLRTILGPNEELSYAWVNYVVLALAFALEATSFRQAVRQTRGEAAERQRPARAYFRDPDDPTVRSVLLEDSAALIGILLAALGVGLHQITGSSVWDGAASLAIGALLVVAAVLLAQTCKTLLIGKQADLTLIRNVSDWLEAQAEIDDVVDLMTMMLGTNRILFCARVDFIDTFSAADLERACARIDADLRREFPTLEEIFIEPVPRSDPLLRQRVLDRYGRVLANENNPSR